MSIRSDAEYALKQLAVIKASCAKARIVSDCAQRATDALERIQSSFPAASVELATEHGRWRYLRAGHGHPEGDSDGPTLMLDGKYGFDADRIQTDAELGHWVLHMVQKDWVTAEDVGNLVRLVSDLRVMKLIGV